jgi:hypothetical protein
MSQTIWSSIVPASTSGTQLAQYLNDFKEAMVSSMSGTSRPTELDAGGVWLDIAADPVWYLKIYDGTTDITLMTIDTSVASAGANNALSTFQITKISADTVAPKLTLLKQRIINNGQVLGGDYVGQIEIKGNANDGSVPVTVRIRGYASQNYTASTAGTDLIFEATPTGSVAIAEMMRLKDNCLGVGTSSPSTTIHASGTGITSEKISADTVGAKVILRKKRIAGNGQVLSGDVVGAKEVKSTDQNGASIDVAKWEYSATQTHTDTAQGTNAKLSVKKTGSASFTTKITVGDETQLHELIRLDQQVDSSTTGSAQSLTPTSAILVVTNNSLTSINNIVPKNGQIILLMNGTSNSITITNDSGGTAANRIVTGTGDDLDLASGASLLIAYDTNATRNRVIGGSGAGGGFSVVATQSIAGGGSVTISTTKQQQLIPVAGSGGAQSLSTTVPFGSSAPKDGTVIEIVGTDNTNTITLTYSDTSKGVVGPFATIVLGKYEKARFTYILALDRYIGGKL